MRRVGWALVAMGSVPACSYPETELAEPPPPGELPLFTAAPSSDAPSAFPPAPASDILAAEDPRTPAVIPSDGIPISLPTVEGELSDLPVVRSEVPARPIIGGTLLVSEEPHRAIVADPDRDLLSVVDLDEDTLIQTVALEPGDEPARLVMGAGTTAYAVLRGGDAVATFDVETGTLTSRIPVCTAPRGLTYDASRHFIVVACHGGEVLGIDESTTLVAWQTTLNDDLRDVVVVSEQYWVSRFKTAELLLVDPDDAAAREVFVPETIVPPKDAAMNPDGSLPSSPGQHQPRVLRRLFTDGNGGIVLHHQRANQGRLLAAYYGRDLQGTGAIAHGAVTTFVAETGTFTAWGALPNAQIYDLAFPGDGLRMAAVSTGTIGSTLHETLVLSRSELSPTAIGDWTTAELEGQVTAVAYDQRGRIVTQSREPATLQILGGVRIPLSDESRYDTGHLLFHASTPSGLSCASCHPEGGDDGMTWDFAIGLRQTAPLYIGVLSTTPLHWQGELGNMPALMLDTMSRMQGDTPSDAQAQAVGEWLDELVPPTPSPLELDEAQQRGQQLFADAGCATCHAGDRFTDNLSHDVGTGGSFQTPSLVGLRHSGPYMHDGCAKTLAQRFDDACG
jgi:hypothetical protein